MTAPSIEVMAEGVEQHLRDRGFVRLARPPVPTTRSQMEEMMRRFHEVAAHLELSVESVGESLVMFRADLSEKQRERLRKGWRSPLN